MKEYNINDKVWIATCGNQLVKLPCPVCFGKLKVTLILGNDEQVETPCDMCAPGFECPRGYIEEYQWLADSKFVTISGKESSEKDGKKEIRYNSYNNYWFYDYETFDTKEEAEVLCQQKIKKHEAEELKSLQFKTANNKKKYSWHVGYHQREAKRALQQYEWHNKKVTFMREKVKKDENI